MAIRNRIDFENGSVEMRDYEDMEDWVDMMAEVEMVQIPQMARRSEDRFERLDVYDDAKLPWPVTACLFLFYLASIVYALASRKVFSSVSEK